MSLVKLNVKKGDTVLVLSGKDKGKQGKVIAAMPKKGKVVVEGVNKVKRHTKPNQKAPQGGILVKEAPMHACKSCSSARHARRQRALLTRKSMARWSALARSAAKSSTRRNNHERRSISG